MSDVKISALSAAAALDGSELVPVVQGGTTVKTTAQDIADLASGGVTSVNGFTGAVNLTSDDVPEGGTNFYLNYVNLTNLLGMPANKFMFSNASSEVIALNQWGIDPATGKSNVFLEINPNNLMLYTPVFDWGVNINPLQNSPSDTATIHSIFANLDSAANGFNFGDGGQSVTLLNLGYNFFGNGSTYGRTNFLNANATIGNGTDPVTLKGHTHIGMFLNIAANATIDGTMQLIAHQVNVDAAAIGTSNFGVSFINDFSNYNIPIEGYQGILLSPNISEMKTNHSFQGFIVNPTISSFAGNANTQLFGLYGTYSNLSPTGWQGFNANPSLPGLASNSQMFNLSAQISGGTGNFTFINISDGGISTSGVVKGLQINVTEDLTHQAIDVTGHCNLSSGIPLVSGQGQQYAHVIGGQIVVPNGTSITGTDVIGNNMAIGVNLGDAGSEWTAASIVGLTTLGFVGQVMGDGDAHGAINFCLNGFAYIHNTGTIDRINNFFAAAVPSGGTGTVLSHVLYYGDMPIGLLPGASDDTWGIRMDDSASAGMHNYLSRLNVGNASFKNDTDYLFEVNDDGFVISTAQTIATATDGGDTGTICWDSNYVYVCIAPNTWKRSALATW